MSQDAMYFNIWFSACYMRLREVLSHYGLDEDAFHDTYLLVREKACNSVVDISDFEAYFRACYRHAHGTGTAPRGAMSIPAIASSCAWATKARRSRTKNSGPATAWRWTS